MEQSKQKRSGGLTELLEFIKNDEKLPEPLYLNLSSVSDEYIRVVLAPFWFKDVSGNSELTPLENAKVNYSELLIMSMGRMVVDERLRLCDSGESPLEPIFGLALNGGLAVLYSHDLVWFRESNGVECWALMGEAGLSVGIE